jgi:broad specificity phosphatase PhoE
MSLPYPPELTTKPFILFRHGQSVFNAGELAQGRGEDEPGNPNGLTEKGREQVENAVAALAAAGVRIDYVSTSELTRAKETGDVLAQKITPTPLQRGEIMGLKEVSQKGWERRYTRAEVKTLRAEAVQRAQLQLQAEGLHPELEKFVPWITVYGEGESPLRAALRGIVSLAIHGPRPHEAVVSHAMLNRYMDAIGSRTTSSERRQLYDLLPNDSLIGGASVLEALHDAGIPDFVTADDPRNRQANGGGTEYTITNSGVWVAHRRIEPPKLPSDPPFIEHLPTPEGIWRRPSQLPDRS